MQVLTSLPTWKDLFSPSFCDQMLKSVAANEGTVSTFSPPDDIFTQLCKLTVGLNSDWCETHRKARRALYDDLFAQHKELRRPDEDNYDILSPTMFRSAICKGDARFETSRQQDTDEFFHYFVNKLTQIERRVPAHPLISSKRAKWGKPFSSFVKFEVESRLCDHQSKHVRYGSEVKTVLSINVTNHHVESCEEGASKRPRTAVSFDSCLSRWAHGDEFAFTSPVTNSAGRASTQWRFKTFPKYLWITTARFQIGSDWSLKKLDVEISVPQEISLEQYRAKGIQQGEVELVGGGPAAEDAAGCGGSSLASKIEAENKVVETMVAMGCNANASRRAARATGYASVDACFSWMADHCSDGDINDPMAGLIEGANWGSNSQSPSGGGKNTPPLESVEMMMVIVGCTNEQATAALIATDNGSWFALHTNHKKLFGLQT
eukprot:GHVN01066635.1.p1 GENE.GHVN01066635.1~~GHVN01066635.1.p1  ORF type:complete len:434 (+),score=68.74 GHVN01066635.1:1176-2477(+)